MTHGTTAGTTLGTTEATGEDGTIRSATGVIGDGAAHGITEDTGVDTIHGIRTMQDGTAVSYLIGAASTMVTEVPA